MTFPTTPILDSFNRANEGPPPSASWTVDPANVGLSVVSNQVAGVTAAAANCAMWTAAFARNNLECYLTIPVLPGVGDFVVVSAVDAVATLNGYAVRYNNLSGTDTIDIRRLTGGAGTSLNLLSQEVSAGDSIGISIVGNIITAYYKSSAGNWTALGYATDGVYTNSTKLYINLNNTLARGDNFGGGTVVPGSASVSWIQI